MTWETKSIPDWTFAVVLSAFSSATWRVSLFCNWFYREIAAGRKGLPWQAGFICEEELWRECEVLVHNILCSISFLHHIYLHLPPLQDGSQCRAGLYDQLVQSATTCNRLVLDLRHLASRCISLWQWHKSQTRAISHTGRRSLDRDDGI